MRPWIYGFDENLSDLLEGGDEPEVPTDYVFWFDGTNVDGSNNSTVIPFDPVPVVVNLGSLGGTLTATGFPGSVFPAAQNGNDVFFLSGFEGPSGYIFDGRTLADVVNANGWTTFIAHRPAAFGFGPVAADPNAFGTLTPDWGVRMSEPPQRHVGIIDDGAVKEVDGSAGFDPVIAEFKGGALAFATMTMWIDGVLENSTSPVGLISNLAGAVYMGGGLGFPNYTGDIFEILSYKRILTVPESAAVTAYLKAKWGIP